MKTNNVYLKAIIYALFYSLISFSFSFCGNDNFPSPRPKNDIKLVDVDDIPTQDQECLCADNIDGENAETIIGTDSVSSIKDAETKCMQKNKIIIECKAKSS